MNKEGKMKFYGKYLGLWQLRLALILKIFLIVVLYSIKDETMEVKIYWTRDKHDEDKENVQNFGEEILCETSTKKHKKDV
jgi:hypothetical protein